MCIMLLLPCWRGRQQRHGECQQETKSFMIEKNQKPCGCCAFRPTTEARLNMHNAVAALLAGTPTKDKAPTNANKAPSPEFCCTFMQTFSIRPFFIHLPKCVNKKQTFLCFNRKKMSFLDARNLRERLRNLYNGAFTEN